MRAGDGRGEGRPLGWEGHDGGDVLGEGAEEVAPGGWELVGWACGGDGWGLGGVYHDALIRRCSVSILWKPPRSPTILSKALRWDCHSPPAKLPSRAYMCQVFGHSPRQRTCLLGELETIKQSQ